MGLASNGYARCLIFMSAIFLVGCGADPSTESNSSVASHDATVATPTTDTSPRELTLRQRAGRLLLGAGSDWNDASVDERAMAISLLVDEWGGTRNWDERERMNAGAYALGCLNSAFAGPEGLVTQEVAGVAAYCETVREAGG